MKLLAQCVALALIATPLAHAQFSLDSRYKDNDGDLVADIPSNESAWVNPSTLIFAYTPVEDPAVYADVWNRKN